MLESYDKKQYMLREEDLSVKLEELNRERLRKERLLQMENILKQISIYKQPLEEREKRNSISRRR